MFSYPKTDQYLSSAIKNRKPQKLTLYVCFHDLYRQLFVGSLFFSRAFLQKRYETLKNNAREKEPIMNNLKLDFKSTYSLQNVQAKTWNQTAWSCLCVPIFNLLRFLSISVDDGNVTDSIASPKLFDAVLKIITLLLPFQPIIKG